MFNFNFDKRTMYIIIAVLVIIAFGRYISSPEAILQKVLTIPAVLIAITFHEFAHAYVADKLGDDTPRRQGRLTLNPLAHLDPVGSVLLLVAGYGWGKPVEISQRNFNRNISMSAGNALVSVAGPAMNFILAIIFTIINFAILKFIPSFALSKIGLIIIAVVEYTAIINVGLGVFNLIPLPPLDGSKILTHFLPYNAKQWFEQYSQIFYIIFVVLWVTGIASQIISPVIYWVNYGITEAVAHLFGI